MPEMKAEIFGYQLTPGQLKIVGAVLDPQVKRLSVCAMTRYGKTRAVAIAVLLYILTNTNKRIAFIAPTRDQTAIIRNYCAEHIAENRALADLVDSHSRGDPESLKKEVSKKRITFRNGCEIFTLTAHGAGEEPGKQLMGFGADIIILDEACLILDEVYRARISRMLGDSPDSKLVELVNPWHRHNFAYRHWQSQHFKRVHINWRQALSEGRVTETFIQEQKEELSTYEFEVLYESIFPTDSEDTLIRWDWIQHAQTHTITLQGNIRAIWALDVGEQGPDLTVLTKSLQDGARVKVTEIHIIKTKETMPTANAVDAIVPKNEQLNVDSIGVGAGVYSRLKELGHNVVSVRVSQQPTRQKDRFLNQKAERYWKLRATFEARNIDITEVAKKHPKLTSQLSQMRYEFTSAGKIKIIDPEGKSPDFADSTMLCMEVTRKAEPVWILK